MLLIVSDIFGVTESLIALSHRLSTASEIFDPYHGEVQSFNNEKSAYEYFIETVGLDTYSAQLAERVRVYDTPVRLIGFSIGASALWNISEQLFRNIPKSRCTNAETDQSNGCVINPDTFGELR